MPFLTSLTAGIGAANDVGQAEKAMCELIRLAMQNMGFLQSQR
jgi:hypothetical protein